MSYLERFSELLQCETQESWREKVFALGKSLGFERNLLAIFPNRNAPIEADFAFLQSNYDTQWRSKYDAENLGYVDPTVTHCVTRTTPLIWSPELFASHRQKEMYEEACAYNLRSGITLPMHGPNGEFGLVCFVSDHHAGKDFIKHAAHTMPEVSSLRDFIFESSARFRHPKPVVRELPKLTRREEECLKWSARGKSSHEISIILNCSEPTVNFHFGNIRSKLNVTNRRHAIVKAIQLGIVDPV